MRFLLAHNTSCLVCISVAMNFLCHCPVLQAQATLTQTRKASPNANQKNKLLVLKSGRIIDGRISHSAGGYLVFVDHGSMLVPFEQVRFEARDLREAYRKLRLSMGVRTASRHIALARWCLSHHLVSEAETELRDALILEPHRRTARSMLSRLSGARNAQSRQSSPEQDLFAADLSEKSYQPVQSLAGLSRDAGKQYMRRIQPILLNKCGNASCHGNSAQSSLKQDQQSAQNRFQLVHVMMGRSNHRTYSELNLAAVLEQINSADPLRSPLLQMSEKIHGGEHRSQFAGASGAQQLMEIKKWIAQVSQELQQKQQYEHTRPSMLTAKKKRAEKLPVAEKPETNKPAKDNPQTVSFREQLRLKTTEQNKTPFQQKFESVMAQQEANQSDNANHSGKANDREQKIGQILKEEATDDAFNPALFNRLVHGIKD